MAVSVKFDDDTFDRRAMTADAMTDAYRSVVKPTDMNIVCSTGR